MTVLLTLVTLTSIIRKRFIKDFTMTYLKGGIAAGFIAFAGPVMAQSFSFTLPQLTFPTTPVTAPCDSDATDCAAPAD